LFKGTIKCREDGCFIVSGNLDGNKINYILCSWELKEIGKLTKKNILKYLRKHSEKR